MKLWSLKGRRLPHTASERGAAVREQDAAAKRHRESGRKRSHRVAFYLAKVKATGQLRDDTGDGRS